MPLGPQPAVVGVATPRNRGTLGPELVVSGTDRGDVTLHLQLNYVGL